MSKSKKPSPSKIFIIQEVSYDYNDEYYSQSEGGRPVQAYLSRDKAEEECLDRNIEELSNKESILFQMGDLPFNDGSFLEKYGINSKILDEYEIVEALKKIIPKLNLEQKKEILDELDCALPYYVCEVQLG